MLRELMPGTADADPLGVDMNITFDNVGGLDGRECSLFTYVSDLTM